MDSFFYFIEDKETNALVLKQIRYSYTTPKPSQQQKELELQRILMTDKLLQLPYAQIFICYSSTNFTIVPDELFSKHQVDAYLRQVTRVDHTQAVGACRLSQLEMRIVYSVDKVVQDVVKSYFPGATHLHIISPLIMQSYQHSHQREGKQVFIHVGNGLMGIVLFDGTRLQIVNTFEFKSDLDFIYYTLMIYEQFKLDPLEVPILISGRAKKKTAIYDQLSKHVKHIEIIHPPSYYQYGSAFADVDFHFYRDLLSMKLCV